jgi:putative membrane protein insertion efficiency factor
MTRAETEALECQANSPETTLAPRLVATRILLAMLAFYRRWLSPAIHTLSPGSGCRYVPTCSEYASTAIAIHGPLKGAGMALWRLLRCNPFTRGGLDPVPPAAISHSCPHQPLP